MQLVKERKAADAIVLPFWEGKKQAEKATSFSEADDIAHMPIAAGDFKGKEGEVMVLYGPKLKEEKRVLLVGLGLKEKSTLETFRKSYAAVVKAALGKKFKTLNIVMPNVKGVASGICEGLLLANYCFDKMKKEPGALLSKVAFIGIDAKEFTECKKLETLIESVNFARDLVNSNADEVTPQRLSECAELLAKEFPKVTATVFGKKEIEKHKMGLLSAVSRGAARDPAFIIIEYKGNPSSKEKTALVGKGITYDTGGLNLKVNVGIETMKCDMAGAAAVMGTVRAAAALGLKVNVVGVIPTTENAIGPHSYKPGDVYISYLGKSVEIADTDAEGRLVLADALAYTEKNLKPTQIIDLATLTGSVVIALGEEIAGLYSADEKMVKGLIEASNQTHERVWPLPIAPEYREKLKSSIADMKNVGGRKGGSIIAALFLQDFVQNTPWAHIDIAGTAYLSDTKPYHPTHATGFGVRLLIAYLEKNGK